MKQLAITTANLAEKVKEEEARKEQAAAKKEKKEAKKKGKRPKKDDSKKEQHEEESAEDLEENLDFNPGKTKRSIKVNRKKVAANPNLICSWCCRVVPRNGKHSHACSTRVKHEEELTLHFPDEVEQDIVVFKPDEVVKAMHDACVEAQEFYQYFIAGKAKPLYFDSLNGHTKAAFDKYSKAADTEELQQLLDKEKLGQKTVKVTNIQSSVTLKEDTAVYFKNKLNFHNKQKESSAVKRQ